MRPRAQITTTAKSEERMKPDPTPAPTETKSTTETNSTPSTQPGTEEKKGQEAASPSGGKATGSGSLVKYVVSDDPDVQGLIDKLLIEGSTFEDVVEAVDEHGKSSVTLNTVQAYFRGNRELQAKRVNYLVQTAELLLQDLGDPESAEARLAKATFLTGYLNLHRDAKPITPKDAEHARMERANLNLKHKLLVVQRDKARDALNYSQERIRMLVLMQQKLKEEIGTLQQDAKRQQAGEPLGPAMLQRIQQIYGLTCQPMPYGGRGDAAKA